MTDLQHPCPLLPPPTPSHPAQHCRNTQCRESGRAPGATVLSSGAKGAAVWGRAPPAAPQPFCLLLRADLALPTPTLPFAPGKDEVSAIPAPAASLRASSAPNAAPVSSQAQKCSRAIICKRGIAPSEPKAVSGLGWGKKNKKHLLKKSASKRCIATSIKQTERSVQQGCEQWGHMSVGQGAAGGRMDRQMGGQTEQGVWAWEG